MGHALPDVDEHQPFEILSNKDNIFYTPDDDENPLGLSILNLFSGPPKDEVEEEEHDEQAFKSLEKGASKATVGRGTPPTMSQLEDQIADVKALYKAKFGDDVDDEDEESENEQETVEKDGMKWVVTRGSPPTMSQLEDRLADVKALYKAKFGEDVDDEDEDEQDTVEKDGIKWVVTRGSPPTMSQLDDRLADVKALYKAKFGEDVDDEDEEEEDESETVEKDGIKWVVTRGSPPTMSQLDDRLADVKALYKAKFGEDVDDEDEEDEQETVEKDGIKWVVTRGSPPTMSQLEDRLADVKALYKAKFGEDVDDEDEEEEDKQEEEGGKCSVQ
jgi:predicted phosphodiesterase